MKNKLLFFIIFSVTLFSLATTITLLFNTSPDTPTIIAAFFASVLLTLFGLIYSLLNAIQYFRYRSTAPWQSTLFNLRLASIVSLVLIVYLLMSAYNIFNVATALVVLALSVVSELLWRRRKGI